jgi:hypothetical protein
LAQLLGQFGASVILDHFIYVLPPARWHVPNGGSHQVVPYAFLRLRPAVAGDTAGAVGRFSDNALLLLPGAPATLTLLPLGGGGVAIGVLELQRRLTVDCPNRLGGCEK